MCRQLVWPCLEPTCDFTSTDDRVVRLHQEVTHPELMQILREVLEEYARAEGMIS